ERRILFALDWRVVLRFGDVPNKKDKHTLAAGGAMRSSKFPPAPPPSGFCGLRAPDEGSFILPPTLFLRRAIMVFLQSPKAFTDPDGARCGGVPEMLPGKHLPRPLLPETREQRLCLSPGVERIRKRLLFLATLVVMGMAAFVPCAYADLYVSS